MFKAMHALDRALDSPVAAALAMATLLIVPLAASLGAGPLAGASARAAARDGLAGRMPSHQMRCWQQGRMLFEENLAALPADGTRYTLKLSGADGQGRPVYVAETSNATCLIRSLADTRPARAS